MILLTKHREYKKQKDLKKIESQIKKQTNKQNPCPVQFVSNHSTIQLENASNAHIASMDLVPVAANNSF